MWGRFLICRKALYKLGPQFWDTRVCKKQIMLVISSYWKKLEVPSVRACFPRPLACCRPVAAWAWWKRFPWKSSILRCLGLLHAVNCRTKLDSHLKFGRCNGFYLMPRKYFWFVVLVVSVIFNVAYLLHLDWPPPKTELPCPTLLKNLQKTQDRLPNRLCEGVTRLHFSFWRGLSSKPTSWKSLAL